MELQPHDKGLRKYVMAFTAIGVIFAGYLASHPLPGLKENFGTFVMGVLGGAGIFSGTNVIEKMPWRRRKVAPTSAK